MSNKIRTFPGGATRDSSEGKNYYGGFISPEFIVAFGDYMTVHRKQSDGSLRTPDNWKKGMPPRECFESLLRHVMDIWLEMDGLESRDGLDEAFGGAMFNLQALWYNLNKEKK